MYECLLNKDGCAFKANYRCKNQNFMFCVNCKYFQYYDLYVSVPKVGNPVYLLNGIHENQSFIEHYSPEQ